MFSTMSSIHHTVFWTASTLLIISIIASGWSMILFFCAGDTLFITGMDLVNALVLLSGIVTIPTNFYILHSIVNRKEIDHKTKLFCCQLWTCIMWILIINFIGFIICIRRIHNCRETSYEYVSTSMKHYRSIPKHKHFMDNLQWILKCCGLHKYNDWFTHDWHDNVHDYEWEPSTDKYMRPKKDVLETDSVPLSCCKSGSCVANFLKELGTYSINTDGCGYELYRLILVSMAIHLIMFLTVIILEILMFKCLNDLSNNYLNWDRKNSNIRQIMAIKNNFNISSGYYLEDSDEEVEINDDDNK